MTEQELRRSLSIMTTNYNKALDENVIALWGGLFIRFDAQFFNKACLSIIASSRFFPTAAEIMDAYQRAKREAGREQYDRLKANHRLLASALGYCYLCDNTGICYLAGDEAAYTRAARCSCPHGGDRGKFSEAQIDRAHLPEIQERYTEREKSMLKHGTNPFYLPTVQEVLGDDFYIFEARKKESHISRRPMTDEEKAAIITNMRGLNGNVSPMPVAAPYSPEKPENVNVYAKS